jgi:hypothetical protein
MKAVVAYCYSYTYNLDPPHDTYMFCVVSAVPVSGQVVIQPLTPASGAGCILSKHCAFESTECTPMSCGLHDALRDGHELNLNVLT